jgi:molybdopterin-guanine dinucleotide biosynthesis protein A
VPRPWSSELAAALRRDREELLVLFVAYRSQLRNAAPNRFEGGDDEKSRLLQETEHDYVALVSVGAEAARLETVLERADREATESEVDLEAILVRQLHELVAAVVARLSAQ